MKTITWLTLLLIGMIAFAACPSNPPTGIKPIPEPTPEPIPVGELKRPVISSFTASPSDLPLGGGDTKLEWVVTDATKIVLDEITVGGSGSKTIKVGATKTFILKAENANGTVTSTVDVTVNIGGLKPATWDSSKWNEATWQ
jgi:hypothetical protein